MTYPETAYMGANSETEVRNELVMAEISQVYYIARQIHERLPQQVPLEDLVHAGVLGLIEAVRNFDSAKRTSLKTFASFRIRGAILDSLRELDWGSRPLRRKGRDITEAIARLANKFGRQPTEAEIADELGMTLPEFHAVVTRLDGLQLVGQQVASQSEGAAVHDLIENAPADEALNPFELCAKTERRELLAEAIETLSEKEQMVVSLYYREELTMKEISAVMSLAESRVSQIHSVAIVKLRSALEQMNIAQSTLD